MKRKKILCILGLVVVMLCTACGSDNNEGATDNQYTEKENTENNNHEDDVRNQDDKALEEQGAEDNRESSDNSSSDEADDSNRLVNVHDMDGNVAISYQVPPSFYLCDKMGNKGVEEFDLTYDNGEFIGMQSEVIKKNSLKEISICSASHEGFPVTKDSVQDRIVATVETKQGNVYDVISFSEDKYRVCNVDDYGKHIHFFIRGWITDDVADKDPWEESEVIDIVTNYF